MSSRLLDPTLFPDEESFLSTIVDDDVGPDGAVPHKRSRNSYAEEDQTSLSYWSLNRSLSEHTYAHSDVGIIPDLSVHRRNLATFTGVFTPVALSMFSTLLFLRLGFVVGQAGVLQGLVMLLLTYTILYMTMLSVCAISTNGAVEGGGAYFMISRALGPEFGGGIGVLFFLANIISCALYVSGCVEAIQENFQTDGILIGDHVGLPSGYRWFTYLYASIILFICFVICLIGATMFARTSIFILCVVVLMALTVVISVFSESPRCCPFTNTVYGTGTTHKHTISSNQTTNQTDLITVCGNFTRLNQQTLTDNWTSQFDVGAGMSFATVFAVLFSGVTGIMNGANMSGELKDPSRSIPRGTLTASAFTFGVYVFLFLLTAGSCSRELLLNSNIYMQQFNVWPPFVVIGIFMTTISAALGNLIGASRILQALARDRLFWGILSAATCTTKSGNPVAAVLISWVLVQLVLLIGSLNAISPLASVFFLLAYASTNLACLALHLTSAPNFRPTFRFFNTWTCVFGLLGCLVMCFLINVIYASAAVVFCCILIITLHLRSFPSSWGSISQALIFHQVRKYLLMLDTRKQHVKYWRPQIILLVSNPRSSVQLIDFVNDIKKSGLYVIGHVCLGTLDDNLTFDPAVEQQSAWLEMIDHLKVKAFTELTVALSVREGMNHLIRLSGLGGMKPNTVCLGFLNDSKSIHNLSDTRLNDNPLWDECDNQPSVSLEEYVQMIRDVLKLKRNLFICRHFHKLDKSSMLYIKSHSPCIDVWPIDFLCPEMSNFFDNTCLFMLQLACVLHMVPAWKKRCTLRVMLCSEQEDYSVKEAKLRSLLQQLRIKAKIHIVQWGHVSRILSEHTTQANESTMDLYLRAVNRMIAEQSMYTVASFLYLHVPPDTSACAGRYINQLDVLSADLAATIFVHGLFPVTSTTL